MKVALQTWGSDGDVRPMIALAAGLVRRGHQATLSIGSVDNKDYSGMCRAVGVGMVLAPEKSASDVSRWLQQMGKTRNPFRMLRFMHEAALFPSHDAMSRAAEAMAAGADLAVGHFLAVPLRIEAKKRAIPYATVSFWPGLMANRARPPDGLPNFGGFINALLWRLGFKLIDRACGEGYRALYQKHGLEFPGSVMDSCSSNHLDLIAASERLWPDTGDLGIHKFSGALSLPLEAEPEPLSPELKNFLSAGEPPVFLSLGSMRQIDAEVSEELLVEIAEHSGERAIVQRDLSRAPPRPESDRLFYVGRLNHSTLLPHCSAVLHHGGAGTTHTVLASGRPAVVCGFMEEQLSWGRALKRSGVGGGCFRYGSAGAKTLGAALGAVARDPKIRSNAARIGALVRAEDGVGEACRQLEALFAEQAGERKILPRAV